jgi:hypothetical protein
MRVFAGDYSGICLGVAGRHGVAQNPAPPCHPLFYWHFGSRTGQGHPLRCVAATPDSTAFGCKQWQNPEFTGDSRAFGCKVGVATGKRACHPLCLLEICRLMLLCSCVGGTERAVFRSINPISNARSAWENARIPINTGGGTQFVSVVPPRASLPPLGPCFA